MAMTIKFIENKLCKTCGNKLHFKNFRKIKANKTGQKKGKFQGWTDSEGGKRFTTCAKCEKDRANKRYRANPIPQLISGFRKRAKKQSVPFNLTVDDMKDLIKNATDMCPALGVKMEIAKLYANDSNYSPSFDRIDPKKGYIKSNIVIVSNRANRIKSDATVDEIRKVADFYEKLLKNK